jgi:hypothetical protein
MVEFAKCTDPNCEHKGRHAHPVRLPLKASGWAVRNTHEIFMRTVGPTEISAMVNWLWIEGVRVRAGVPDDTVRELFKRYAGGGVALVEVTVRSDG